jgi:membrane protein implicated in regulation of membrane protease activity
MAYEIRACNTGRMPLVWSLLAAAMVVAGAVLMLTGSSVAGLGVVSAGTLINSVLLFRRQIRAADERYRRQ